MLDHFCAVLIDFRKFSHFWPLRTHPSEPIATNQPSTFVPTLRELAANHQHQLLESCESTISHILSRVPSIREHMRMGGSYHLDPRAPSMILRRPPNPSGYLAGDQMVQHATHDSLSRHDVCAGMGCAAMCATAARLAAAVHVPFDPACRPPHSRVAASSCG